MSGEALRDLRHVIAELRTRGEAGLADLAVGAVDALVADGDQLRNVLAFYADPVNYENATPRHVRPIITDRGALAARALAHLHRKEQHPPPSCGNPSCIEHGVDRFRVQHPHP